MGPTASGKSAYAIELARRYGGEIVSVDSALVYRGLDIGAAKPSREEQAQAPHHLIDLRAPWQPYSAAEFAADAQRAIDAIVARGRLPILAGGTGLYFRALLEGLSDMPEADETMRAAIASEAQERGWAALHAELAQIDPDAAARIHATDAQRIQRALEVFRLSGRPISDWQRGARGRRLPLKVMKLALAPPQRATLHQRIERRFDAMLEAGFLDEVRALRALPELASHPRPLDLPALRAVGYRQAWDYLGATESPSPPVRGVRVRAGDEPQDALNPPQALRATFSQREQETQFRERAIAATRQLAKRQYTWLRGELDARWFDPLSQRDALDAAVAGFLGA
jgi:tRNA dimethylallyltransferase